MNIRLTVLFIFILGALPVVALAQAAPFQYSQQGVISCRGGGAAQSIGSQSATAGIYVPVADATVELNTGILVYKECVLRQIVKKMAESATSQFTGQMVNAITTGREGNPQFVVNEGKEIGLVQNRGFYQGITAGQNALHPTLRGPVTNATARNVLASTQKPESILTCPFRGNLDAFSHAQFGSFSFEGLAAAGDPACYTIGAVNLFRERAGAVAATAVEYQENDWNRGRGFYSRTDLTYDPLAANIRTPASVMQESFQTVFSSGFRQLENANDVGQIVSALFAGIINQVVSNSGGLSGLNQSVGGQPSYLNQMTSQTSAGLIVSVVNASLDILNKYRSVEVAYLQALNAILQALGQAAAQLRDVENQCWDRIIPRAQAYATEHSFTIEVATSTQFSQAIIDSQIAPLTTATMERATTSRSAIQKIDLLAAALVVPATQQATLQAIDALVAQGAFHTAQDLGTVRQQQQAVTDAMTTLVQETITKWSENTDPNVGWCNVGNPNVIKIWAEKWKK